MHTSAPPDSRHLKAGPSEDAPSSSSFASSSLRPAWQRWLIRSLVAGLVLILTGVIFVAMIVALAYPKLPDVSDLMDYRPKLPLRVYSQEGKLLGEFGEERRTLTRINEFPKVMRDAILAIEDARFYEHSGVDITGVLRAGLNNLWSSRLQGASTITMQTARNVYLSSERTVGRKFYELLLTFKLESQLSKDQILELYMNQIFLGQRAYGFAAAAETYFGKPIQEITLAEAAMLAGLPKAPSAYNPFVNLERAVQRQRYILERMQEVGVITKAQMLAAKAEPLHLRPEGMLRNTGSDFVAEMVRQIVYAQYGEETYTRGLNVYTGIKVDWQQAAYKSLRTGIMDFERRQVYRGPEAFVSLSDDPAQQEDEVIDALAEHPDNGDLYAAVVLDASEKSVLAQRSNGEIVHITGEGLGAVRSSLSDKASPRTKILRGAVIRLMQNAKQVWFITQLPEVEGAFVALNPQTGSIEALVGGFDFNKNKFNHVTQAWRQPGSSFKPFIYSAALEKGLNGATVIDDAPLFFSSGAGGQAWEPKNYDGKFEGPMTLRKGLARSKNMVSIRILQQVGAQEAQDWITRFGFDADKHPPYLTMALGAGSVTPLQMASAYSVFASGGYRMQPWLIAKITDERGRVLVVPKIEKMEDAKRVIDERNAFVMDSLLQEVTRSGTAAKAQAALKRPDLYGKTGTTNDAHDTWFAGFQPSVVAVVWIGYDTPKKLGDRETGGGLSLPVWINFMQTALKGVPVSEYPVPDGVVNRGGEWYYDEFAKASPDGPSEGVGTDSAKPSGSPPSGEQERNSILDLFR